MPNDEVNHPAHYTAYEGVEVIQLTEQMNFNRGNAVKYIARAGLKSYDTEILDLKKALWYIQREINRMEAKLRTEGENEVLDALRRKLMAPLDERDLLEAEILDLKKVLWYIQREINRMEAKLRTEGENEVLDALRRKLMAPYDERDLLEDQS